MSNNQYFVLACLIAMLATILTMTYMYYQYGGLL